jgi:hypothetical protein
MVGFASGLMIAGLVVVGCSSVPPPAAPPAASIAESASPTPLGDEEALARIIVGGAELLLVGEHGSTLERVPYSLAPEQAITILTDALGAAPVLKAFELVEPCSPPGYSARWAQGAFELDHGSELWLPDDMQFRVIVQDRAIGEVLLTTTNGFSVGDSIDDFAEEFPEFVQSYEFASAKNVSVPFEVVAGPVDPQAPDYLPFHWGGVAYGIDGEIVRFTGGTLIRDYC